MGLLFATHFRLYHRVDWSLALWWGLKDWYLWGLFAPAILWLTRRVPLARDRGLWPLFVHLIAAGALSWLHAILAISLSALVEGLGGEPFLDAVGGLFLKRYALSFVTYTAIVGLGHASQGRGDTRPARSEDSSGERSPPVGTRASSPDPAERLLVRKGDQERFLATERIDRVEAEGNYVRLHAGDEAFLERRTLKSLEEQLDPSRFLRIHRSHLVHVDRVDRIEARPRGGYVVVLRDGSRLPLSRTYRKRLEERVGRSL